ncbi:MAG: c-type cytochrome [Betaproteobacteria bacterium]
MTLKQLLLVAMVSLASPLVHADPVAGEKKAEVCVACHGPGGNSPAGAFPILAGQTFRYTFLQLRDFKEGRRKDPVMSPMAEPLSRDDMIDLAEYFARQKPKATSFKPDAARAERGRKKSEEVLCTMCHLGGFLGQNEIPRVAGQWPEYVIKQLKDFKARTRTNDAGNMTAVAQTISEEDIVDLAHFVGGL